MLAGVAALPVCAAGYLTYQKLTDAHLLTYPGYGTSTADAAWSPDGRRIASAGWQNGGIVQIWNATSGQTLQTCRTEQLIDAVYPLDIIWSADGASVLAFVGWDRNGSLRPGDHIIEMVQIWNAATGQRVRSIPVMGPVPVNAIGSAPVQPLVQSWALNEGYLAAAKLIQNTTDDPGHTTIEIWNIATGSKITTLDAGNHKLARRASPAWSPDHEKLAIHWSMQDSTNGQFFQVIEIWNIATGSKVATLDAWRQSPISSIADMVWSPDNERLALRIESADTTFYEVWNALSGKRMQTFKPAGPNLYPIITWSPDGRYIATRTEVYDVHTGNRITTYPLQGNLGSLAWSPDGSRVALVDIVQHGHGLPSINSSTLLILDALSGKSRAQYPGRGLFGNIATSGKLVWSPDGKYIMVVGLNFDIWKGV